MKLHIGGQTTKEGWKILNIQKKDGVDFVGDLTDLSQFSDNSVEEVYASHVLEHVGQKKVLDTLKGVNRILNKDGKFYISVPDMDVLCKIFIDEKAGAKVKFHTMRMMFGGQIDDYDFHYFGWNFEFLNDYLMSSNFSKVERVNSFGLFEDTSNYKPYGFPISLNVIAYK
jgi:predicted SAM-dependent methyltransferase